MNCVIPGQNLKVMGKAIHALARIGDELFILANEDNMIISTVNMSKTSYAVVKFMSSFFTHYNMAVEDSEESADGESLRCKVPMKAILSVFKSPIQMEKQVEVCRIELNKDPTKITFKFRYKHDVNKTHSIWLLDGDSLRVSFNHDTCNQMTATSAVFTQALANFQLSDEEVSFDVSPEKMIMRNFIEGESTRMNHVRSQLSLNPCEFDCYKITQNTCITFALKPFRAAIQFAESFGMGITMNFQMSGKPLMLIISNVTFEANFILSTINNDGDSQTTMTESLVSENIVPALPRRLIQKLQTSSDSVTTTESMIYENRSLVRDSINTSAPKTYPDSMDWDNETDENSELANLVVPNSPEGQTRKKLKSIFKRCFEPTFLPHQLDENEVVLAENSDPEFSF